MHCFLGPLSLTLLSAIFSCRGNITIAQSSPEGTELFVVNATDADEPGTPNVNITFSLDDPTLPFLIDPESGNLTTAPNPDVRTYNVVVVASDAGTPSLSSSASFFVTVAAPNSYEPEFMDDLEFSLVEEQVDTDVVFTFTVQDLDVGEEGRVTLSLLPGDYSDAFNLTYSSEVGGITRGQLFQVESFDREMITNFTLSVRAVDQGNELFRRTSEATISVIVADINDNSPAFIESSFTARVAEHSNISTFVVQIVAEDDDTGSNAEILYKIDPDVAEFIIDPVTGNITVNAENLDRRLQSSYSFNVTATDRGDEPLSNTTTVVVSVTEVNDNPPFFDPLPPNTIMIPENTQPGYVLFNISVEDNDTLSAGEVTIVLVQTGNIFALTEDNQLILNEAVDYEVSKNYP